MTKVLILGHFLEKIWSGWRYSAEQMALALDSIGIEVVLRSINSDSRYWETVPTKIKELLGRSAEGSDYVIQHTLPHNYEYCGDFKKNIGVCFLDSVNLKWSGWISKIKLLDETWVSNSQINNYLIGDEKINSVVFPVPCDTSKYEKVPRSIDIPNRNGDFLFYYVGDLNRRKNITGLLEAFYTEFRYGEPVNILLKISKPNVNAEINRLVDVVQQNLKLKRYKRPLVLTQEMTEDELLRLAISCDCYVSSAYSESWGIPIFSNFALGKQTIAVRNGGPRDYLPGISLVGCSPVSCTGMLETFEFLNTAREKFWRPNLDDLRSRMRLAFENQLPHDRPNLEKYSYETVGNEMANRLFSN